MNSAKSVFICGFILQVIKMRATHNLRIVFWGTYDVGKPRVRLLIAGAKQAGMEVRECHVDVWQGISDKTQMKSFSQKCFRLLKWFWAYPKLITKYLVMPAHDVVIVPYMGQVDVLVLWLFSRLRGVCVAWDAFFSLYDTFVNDRSMVRAGSLSARLLYALEWLSCRAVDLVFLDTGAHARYFESTFRLKPYSVKHIYVGAETEIFQSTKQETSVSRNPDELEILFYGQFIPLHGIETIIRAAARIQESGRTVRWIVAGQGQEQARIDALIEELQLENVERVLWIPYEQLNQWIERADVCLGIFGTSGKATRVIPNKVFQILAVGRPLITADTPAIREMLTDRPGIWLIPGGDSDALAKTVIVIADKKIQEGRLPDVNVEGIRIGAFRVGADLASMLAQSAFPPPYKGGG